MNIFDIAVIVALIVAIVAGFRAGLLRSAVTMLAYLLAMPLAAWIMTLLSPAGTAATSAPLVQNSLLFFAVFLISGLILGKMARMAIDETMGAEAGLGDRLAGALLGAARVGLVAVTLVLIFDRLVPADRQPPYLTGSQLRPWLSVAGQKGFRSLPPDIASYIDRLKKDRQI